MIKVTEQNLNELANTLEILEVLDDGIRFYGSRNGVVVREMFAKWGESVEVTNGVTNVYPVEDNTEEIVMKINLPEGLDKVIESTSEVELKEMCDAAMEKAVKPKKVKTSCKKKGE